MTTGITGPSRGLHKLTVRYGGGELFEESQSRTIRVVVYQLLAPVFLQGRSVTLE